MKKEQHQLPAAAKSTTMDHSEQGGQTVKIKNSDAWCAVRGEESWCKKRMDKCLSVEGGASR